MKTLILRKWNIGDIKVIAEGANNSKIAANPIVRAVVTDGKPLAISVFFTR